MALQSVEDAVKTCGFVVTLIDEHRDELEACNQFTRGLAAKLLEEGQELSSAKDTIAALQQQVASLELQLLSTPQVPPQQQPTAAERPTTSEPSCQQHQQQQQQQLEAALGELESLRGQLADLTTRQQQQVAATEVAAAEVAELRRLAAEVEPLRQRVEEAESAAEAMRLQTAVSGQQLRRQLEASRGQQVAALQLRLAAVEKEAATARSEHVSCKFEYDILVWKYEKLIAEKIVLQRLYDVLYTSEELTLEDVGEAVVKAHDGLCQLAEAAKARRLRREQYRREAQQRCNMVVTSWCR
ncbi:hypothetical protein PLESTM_001495900 [Pleodorina starrii]|nr:hypothetical protein PLESTM_001495900 [Pleodorina starrii]